MKAALTSPNKASKCHTALYWLKCVDVLWSRPQVYLWGYKKYLALNVVKFTAPGNQWNTARCDKLSLGSLNILFYMSKRIRLQVALISWPSDRLILGYLSGLHITNVLKNRRQKGRNEWLDMRKSLFWPYRWKDHEPKNRMLTDFRKGTETDSGLEPSERDTAMVMPWFQPHERYIGFKPTEL